MLYGRHASRLAARSQSAMSPPLHSPPATVFECLSGPVTQVASLRSAHPIPESVLPGTRTVSPRMERSALLPCPVLELPASLCPALIWSLMAPTESPTDPTSC